MGGGGGEGKEKNSRETGGRGSASSLKVFYTNAQSVVNKMAELRAVVIVKQPDVITLTETWTNSDISDEFLNIDGYELIERKDREDTDRGRGGGILVYIAKEICAWKVKVPGCFEQCALVKIKAENCDLGIHVVYRSPNSSSHNDASLCELLTGIQDTDILIGDFNFPGIRWEIGKADAKSRTFYEKMEDSFLIQHVDEPTHKSGNLLDLIISKDEQLVENVEHEGRLGKSDHEMLIATLRIKVVEPSAHAGKRNYDRANFSEMRKEMKAENWEEILGQTGVEQCWCIIRDFFTN